MNRIPVILYSLLLCFHFSIMHADDSNSSDIYAKAAAIALPDDPAATETDKKFIARAYEIARNAVDNGNHPFGALLVHNGVIIMEYENHTLTTKDITEHAEAGLIGKATQVLPAKLISESTLYTSTEPCLMCCGAIYWAKVKKVVYGVKSSQFSKLLGYSFHAMDSRNIYDEIDKATTVIGPISEKTGLMMHADFWIKKE